MCLSNPFKPASMGALLKSFFITDRLHQKAVPLSGNGFLVPVAGLEPARRKHQRILSPPCLPFHHTGIYRLFYKPTF